MKYMLENFPNERKPLGEPDLGYAEAMFVSIENMLSTSCNLPAKKLPSDGRVWLPVFEREFLNRNRFSR